MLLYPLYAVLFIDHGLSAAQISSLFIIWSVAGVTLEIPSGVLADMISRRVLLACAPLLSAAGFALWTFAPSYSAFAAGFILWGAKGAIESGAIEALIYEELERHGASSRYATVMGRATAAGTVAVALSMAAAGPVFGAGGFEAVGLASVVACLATAVVAATLPEPRKLATPTVGRTDGSGFTATLRAGFGEVRHRRPVLIAATFLIAISVIWQSLDEYVPLLAVDTGVPTERLPALILIVYAGVALGGTLGGIGSRMPRRAIAAVLAVAAIALAVGALTKHPAGFVMIGLAFAAFQVIEIGADARLQDSIAGPSRSTVTSVAGFGTEVVAIGIYATYGLASAVATHAVLFAIAAGAYIVLALFTLAARAGTR